MERILPLVAAIAWFVVGLAMVLWPARVMSLTIRNWHWYEKSPIKATALVWYRVSGVVFVLVASVVIYVLANRA